MVGLMLPSRWSGAAGEGSVASTPAEETLTRVIVLRTRSKTKMSETALVSAAIRLLASEPKAM